MSTVIKRYQEYSHCGSIAYEFVDSFVSLVNEGGSVDKKYKKAWRKISGDLKLNLHFIATFGTAITVFLPVVDKLMKNMNISTEITYDKIVLLTICALTIIYLEEKKFKSSEEEEELVNGSKSMLEELKMYGIGNGIVKSIIKSVESIKNVFYLIGKHLGAVGQGIIDMFAYTSLFVPVMNGIYYLIGKYELTPDSLSQNLIGLGVGLGTIIAKHGIIYIVNRIKDKFNLNKDDVLDDIEIEEPVIKKFSLYNKESDIDAEPINEQ